MGLAPAVEDVEDTAAAAVWVCRVGVQATAMVGEGSITGQGRV